MVEYSGTIAVINQGNWSSGLAEWYGSMKARYPYLQLSRPEGNQIPRARNMAALEFPDTPWVLFVDSDVLPPIDALSLLLEVPDDVVGAVVLERYPAEIEGKVTFPVSATRSEPPYSKYVSEELKGNGPIPVHSVGMACTLVRRSLFKRMREPYFRAGQIDPQYLTEDSEFCLRASDSAGAKVSLHLGVRAGHRVRGIVWPGADGNVWVEWPGPARAWQSFKLSE